MADQEHDEQGKPIGLTLKDLCGGHVLADTMLHVPEPKVTPSICHLHHHFELQHHGLSSVKADFHNFDNHSSSFAGLRGGLPTGLPWLESTRSMTCPTLGSDDKNEMLTVADHKAWVCCSGSCYGTNSMAMLKKNSELLAFIRGNPAQVLAVCVPIIVALRSDGIQKIGESLDAYFGVDGCRGVLSAVHGVIHSRRGHKSMAEHSTGVAKVVGRIDLHRVVIGSCFAAEI